MSQIEVITGEASKRYAQALLDLACESKSLKIIENDISKLKKILLESNDLQKAISSPVIDVEKIKGVKKITNYITKSMWCQDSHHNIFY